MVLVTSFENIFKSTIVIFISSCIKRCLVNKALRKTVTIHEPVCFLTTIPSFDDTRFWIFHNFRIMIYVVYIIYIIYNRYRKPNYPTPSSKRSSHEQVTFLEPSADKQTRNSTQLYITYIYIYLYLCIDMHICMCIIYTYIFRDTSLC